MAMFDRERTAGHAIAAPHLSHAREWELYTQLVLRVFRAARQHSEAPRILDLGAGGGSATIPFLDLGARVTAVDISESQLEPLRGRCGRFGSRLEVRQVEVTEILD